nr:PREDICTED: receptor-type tyrosine-protein phosphatase N2-like [Latimeria chalumnae]|eukprot:XP_014352302.1 PREDICTED: receptor-type tyrosine-protein phosphatase N2-like [Latimeria chalumnae]
MDLFLVPQEGHHIPLPPSEQRVPLQAMEIDWAIALGSGRSNIKTQIFESPPFVFTYNPLTRTYVSLYFEIFILKTLQGLTWQDESTQKVLASELSNLHKIHYRHPETSSVDSPTIPRTAKQSVDSDWIYGFKDDSDLTKSIQQYLQYLGLLSQSLTPTLPQKTKSTKPTFKNDAVQSDRFVEHILQKLQGKASSLPFSPASHQQYPENPPLRTLSSLSLEKGQPPLGADFPSDEAIDGKSLMAALQAYFTQKISVPNVADTTSVGKIKGPHLFASRVQLPVTNHLSDVGSKADQGGFQSKTPPHQKPMRPKVDKPSYKSSSSPGNVKEPLTFMDETFIQNVVRELGKHEVNVEALSPKELDDLAEVIADALQVVDGEDGKKKDAEIPHQEVKNVYPQELEEYERDEDDIIQDIKKGEDQGSFEEDEDLNVKPEDFWHKKSVTESPLLDLVSDIPSKLDVKKTEALASSSEEEKFGVENVKSKTFSREMTVEKKADPDLNSEEFADLQDWIPDGWIQDESSNEKLQKKAGEGLQLDVKSSTNDRCGYIVTEEDPLNVEKGIQLIKDLADILHLQMSAFSDVNILGPAVTFKVQSNSQNMTTVEVANAAVAHKIQLQKATGLKIVQAGTGEVRKLNFLV